MQEGARRLAALLLTDMVGYVSLTQQNELLALRLLEEHTRQVGPVFVRHGGRVVKSIGDAFLVEFESALAAVECAIELQRRLHEAERERPSESVRVRIGVHVGDVVHRDSDVFGDAVNLVSRLTPLADPGGICLTEPVVEQVRQRIDFACRPIELPPLRHVEFPVSAYRVELPWLEDVQGFRSPWTDRRKELDLLEHALTRAVNGQPGAVFIEGEAGIGKTRLAEEAIRRAKEHGFRVLRGGFVGDLAAPYSAWTSGLREFVEEAPAPLLYKVLGVYSGDLAKLVPELLDRVGQAPVAAGPEDPDLGRRRLFDGVAHSLATLARESPVLLFLDDLHNADDASLHLLRHVIRSLRADRMLFVGAFRDTEVDEDAPLRQALVDLGREHLVSTVHLDRLGFVDVQRLVEANYGGPVRDPDLANAVLERTGGNPFFVEELVRSLSERDRTVPGPLRSSVTNLPWPETVRRVLRQRLLRLPPETVRLLELASVLGSSFRLDVLGEVAGTPEEPLLEALEGALRARVLTECRRDHGPLACSFSDRQTRDLLYRDLSQIRARRYHRHAAEVLERRYGNLANEHAEELAYHWLMGEGTENALRYTLVAAKRAVEVYAREAAIRHYRTALDLIDEADSAQLAPVLEALGEQEMFNGEMDECRRHYDEAARQFEKAGVPLSAARVWFRAARIYRWAFYDLPGSTTKVERARKCLEGLPESGELAALNAELAGQFAQQFNYPAARQELAKALAVAERAHDARTATQVRLSLVSLAPPEEIDRSRKALVEELLPGVEAQGEPDLIRSAYTLLSDFLCEVDGDARASVRCLEHAVELLRARGAISSAADLSGQDLAAAHLVLGELPEAKRLAQEGYAYGLRNYPTPDAPNLAVLGEIARLEGDAARAEELLSRSADLLERSGARAYRFWVEGLHLRLEIDREAYSAASERFERMSREVGVEGRDVLPMFASMESRTQELAVRAAVGRSDAAAARRSLDRCREIAGRVPTDTTRGYLYRAEGTVARGAGEAREAADGFRQSAEVFRRLGWRYEEAESEELLARSEEAAGELERALGAIARVDELRGEMGLPPAPRRIRIPQPA